MKTPLRLASIVAIFLAASASAQTTASSAGGTGVVYADSSAIIVTAPAGWVLDAEAGKPDGLQAVFYRTGESWRDGRAVMYVNPSDAGVALARVLANDSADFRAKLADLKIEPQPAVRRFRGDSVVVRVFASDASHNFDAVAYLPEDDRVWLIVLTARDRASLGAALPAFRELVQSCMPARMQQRSAPGQPPDD